MQYIVRMLATNIKIKYPVKNQDLKYISHNYLN